MDEQSSLNPYTPPVAAEAEALAPFSVHDRRFHAGMGQRFLNHLVDQAAIYGFSFITMMGVGLSVGEDTLADIDRIPNFVLSIPFIVIYYSFMEGIFGRTFGKWITGTKVVDEVGNKPSLGKIIARSFCRVIPFDALSFLGSEARGWHDTFPRTWVVKTRGLERIHLSHRANDGFRPAPPIHRPPAPVARPMAPASSPPPQDPPPAP